MNENEQTGDAPENVSVDAAAALPVEISGGAEAEPVPVIDVAGALVILDQTEQGISGFHGMPVSASDWLAVKFSELRAALQ